MGSAEESTVIIVPMECAQKIRFELEKLKLWNASYKLKKLADTGQVAIPVDITNENHSVITDKWPDFKIARIHLPFSKAVKIKQNRPASVLQSEIKCLLKHYGLSEQLLDEVPSKWERHEDLVIIPANSFASPEWSLMGNKLWHVVAKCLICKRLAHHSTVANDRFRSSKVVMLLGDNCEVIHVDNGIKYSYDVTKCMFSVGNITEKMRVANLDCRNETIVDLYAGIGYFTLPYLVHTQAHHVHACEWNPYAVLALKRNLQINGVLEKCTVHEGDNRLLQLPPLADRVNLGLIPSSEEGWPVAVQVLKECGGVLHIHGNITTSSQGKLLSESNVHDVCQKGQINKLLETENEREQVPVSCQQKEVNNVNIEERVSRLYPRFCENGEKNNVQIKEQDSAEEFIQESRNNGCKVCGPKGIEIKEMIPDSKRSCSHDDVAVDDGTVVKIIPVDTSQCLVDDASLYHTNSNLEKTDPVDVKSQQQQNVLEKNVVSEFVEHSPVMVNGKPVKGISNNCLLSLNIKVDELFHDFQKNSGKGHILLACQEWSLYVQRKIKSLLQAKKGGMWTVAVLHIEVVKSYAPHVVHAVLDLECRPI
uniref:tRNA(Phe) (4-demethylwyosine(37)-C(7)) aminocarboxypropyltransferase n=1 Tax=Arion vulgaris TaxID=1028688 RepID=A0A0B7AUP4_9EUPU